MSRTEKKGKKHTAKKPSYPPTSVLPSRHPYGAILVRLVIYYIVSSAVDLLGSGWLKEWENLLSFSAQNTRTFYCYLCGALWPFLRDDISGANWLKSAAVPHLAAGLTLFDICKQFRLFLPTPRCFLNLLNPEECKLIYREKRNKPVLGSRAGNVRVVEMINIPARERELIGEGAIIRSH